MAEIRAFRALRFTPKAGGIKELTCPPYDIISEEQRQAYLQTNPHNVIRLELPRDGENPYQTAGETLRDWVGGGILARDEQPGIYIYEEEFTAHGKRMAVRGFVCGVKIEEFSKGVVLPHEETLSKAKTDRFNLMQATFCNFSQIYSLYMDDGATGKLIDALASGAPDVEFADEAGIIQRLWAVHDPAAIAAITARFADKKLYIADGHHRYETALNFRNAQREQGIATEGGDADYVMMMLVDMDHPGLVVFPTHRLIRDLADFDAGKIKAACAEYFDVEEKSDLATMEAEMERQYQAGKKSFALYAGGAGWTLLTLKDPAVMAQLLPDLSEASQGLDVTVLHTLILEKLMVIDKANMAAQINLTYTKQAEDAVAGVQGGEFQCAFILNPTRVSEIRDVASAGEKMPQKSTYFYPKVITGLVMNQMVDLK